jgi:hypothetical protein
MTNAEHRRTAVDIAVIVPHDIAVVDIDSWERRGHLTLMLSWRILCAEGQHER